MIINKKRAEMAQEQAQKCGTYKTEAGELLKDWGNLYEFAQAHAVRELCDISKYLTITGGDVSGKYDSIYNRNINRFMFPLNANQADDVFGLAYTSSSAFAALWVCNVSAALTYNPSWKLHGVAINTDCNAVFVFDEYNKNGEEIGMKCFDEIQMAQWLRAYEKAQNVKNLDKFTAKAYEIAEQVPSILAKYAGKPYGEKTKQKIYNELRTVAGDYAAWLDDYGMTVKKLVNFCGYLEKVFYFKYLDDNNKILHNIIIKAEKPSKTAEQAAKEQPKTAAKIKKLCMELLPLLEEFNKNARILNQSEEKTNTSGANIRYIAQYGAEE